MIRRILAWLAAVFVSLILAALAQGQPPTPPQQGQPPAPERGPPVPEYAVAILCTLVILTVVCMPSRKR